MVFLCPCEHGWVMHRYVALCLVALIAVAVAVYDAQAQNDGPRWTRMLSWEGQLPTTRIDGRTFFEAASIETILNNAERDARTVFGTVRLHRASIGREHAMTFTVCPHPCANPNAPRGIWYLATSTNSYNQQSLLASYAGFKRGGRTTLELCAYINPTATAAGRWSCYDRASTVLPTGHQVAQWHHSEAFNRNPAPDHSCPHGYFWNGGGCECGNDRLC